MSHWPGVDRAADRTMVEALRGGDRSVPPLICDTYCARLYDYAHASVRDDAAAATVVQDTMIAAKSHIQALAHPERLHSWLYAIARGEALYRLGTRDVRSASRPPSLEPPEDDDVARERTMVRDALAALRPRDRELLRLYGPHRLGTHELAVTLDRPERQVPALLRTARADFTDTVRALIVARTGRTECGPLSELLDESGGGPLTPALRRRLVRHIDDCSVCGDQCRVSTDALLPLMPIAEPPPDLKDRAMTAMFDPDAVAYRARVAHRVGAQLRRDGNPRRPELAGRPPWRTLAAAATVSLLVGLLLGMRYGGTPVAADGVPPGPAEILAPGSSAPRGGPGAQTGPQAVGSPTATPSAGGTPRAVATPTRRPGERPAESPGPTDPEPVTGTLSVSPTGDVPLGAEQTSITVTLTATGAPVAWSASGSASISSTGGTASPGSPSTVTVSVTRDADGGSASATFTSTGGGGTVTLTWPAEPPSTPPASGPA
ncbi:MAG: hypothetical protein GEV11_17390 [Streptosporangiales bacterium]|nr:hypothetical protein [Streptosporangiales bacterium]